MNIYLVWIFVSHRRTDRQTESEAYEPTVHTDRWAQKLRLHEAPNRGSFMSMSGILSRQFLPTLFFGPMGTLVCWEQRVCEANRDPFVQDFSRWTGVVWKFGKVVNYEQVGAQIEASHTWVPEPRHNLRLAMAIGSVTFPLQGVHTYDGCYACDAGKGVTGQVFTPRQVCTMLIYRYSAEICIYLAHPA